MAMSNLPIAVATSKDRNGLKCGNSYLVFNGVKIAPSSELCEGNYVGIDKQRHGYFIYIKNDVAKIVKKYISVGLLETNYYIDGKGFVVIEECIHCPFYDVGRIADEMFVSGAQDLREAVYYLVAMTSFYKGSSMGLDLKGDVIGQLDKIRENYAKMVMYRALGFKTVRDVNLYKLGWKFDFHTKIEPVDMDVYKECQGCISIRGG